MSDPTYIALHTHSYYVPGDERSRTNPGHGYPGGNETVNTYTKFKNKEEMLSWVRIYGKNTQYEIFTCNPVEITLEYTATIKE